MSYVVAAYGITGLVLGLYVLMLRRELKRLEHERELQARSGSGSRPATA